MFGGPPPPLEPVAPPRWQWHRRLPPRLRLPPAAPPRVSEPDEFEKMFQAPAAPVAPEPKREPASLPGCSRRRRRHPIGEIAGSCNAGLVFPRAGRVHADVSGIPDSSDRGASAAPQPARPAAPPAEEASEFTKLFRTGPQEPIGEMPLLLHRPGRRHRLPPHRSENPASSRVNSSLRPPSQWREWPRKLHRPWIPVSLPTVSDRAARAGPKIGAPPPPPGQAAPPSTLPVREPGEFTRQFQSAPTKPIGESGPQAPQRPRMPARSADYFRRGRRSRSERSTLLLHRPGRRHRLPLRRPKGRASLHGFSKLRPEADRRECPSSSAAGRRHRLPLRRPKRGRVHGFSKLRLQKPIGESAPPPPPRQAAPPSTPPAQEAGEFTRLFQTAPPKPIGESAPPPPSPKLQYRLCLHRPKGGRVHTAFPNCAAEADRRECPSSAAQAGGTAFHATGPKAGEFTRLFQSPPPQPIGESAPPASDAGPSASIIEAGPGTR